MPKPWRFLRYDAGHVQDLCRALNVTPLLAQVLSARGYTSTQEAASFLNARLNELRPPLELAGTSAAADRLVEAIQAGRRITIYGDYDVDGVTGTSLLWRCLKAAQAHVDYYIPHRIDEGYGLNAEALRKMHAEDPARLLVTVDCGISALDEARLAQELGMDLVVTDHHHFGPTLPPAAAIVHPHLPPEPYPHGALCGAGVAFKLAWAVGQRLGDGVRAPANYAKELLHGVALSAIGTVADVVPLVGENRVLVHQGLKLIAATADPGLRALLNVCGLSDKKQLASDDLGFGLAPRINAAGRLGQARLAVELLTTSDRDRAKRLAEYINEQNGVRQTVERRILKQARELVDAHPRWLDQQALVLAHSEWHPGVIGIVASRLVELYDRPVVMLAVNAESGIAGGSARTFGRFDLHAGLAACQNLLLRFGGHRAAAGLALEAERIDEFRDAFCGHIERTHRFTPEERELLIDAEVRLHDLTGHAVRELDRLGPFGRDNPRPVFSASGVELTAPPKKIGQGERHLSVTVRQHGKVIRGVSWGHADWAEEMAAARGPLAISFAPSINEFNGMENVEMQLIDWKPAHDA